MRGKEALGFLGVLSRLSSSYSYSYSYPTTCLLPSEVGGVLRSFHLLAFSMDKEWCPLVERPFLGQSTALPSSLALAGIHSFSPSALGLASGSGSILSPPFRLEAICVLLLPAQWSSQFCINVLMTSKPTSPFRSSRSTTTLLLCCHLEHMGLYVDMF